ncbi:PREDICTED: DNA topoisomerase 2-alpha-like isoform X4 [Branchiostoma belcheri]|uniref:DNA topoisomerase 2 n=1 Tax=Branchiostoma belcheri TaxID=7741 RepID=A0A6P4Y166_BRABE|nr:PREDICTED: DNA topoisomerase 2-alpha-like isoform X4 [Branchiostoma belcheri]
MDAESPLRTLFDNAQKKAEKKAAAGGDAPPAEEKGGKNKKRLSVERIYQKKTQLEHILLRPDTYIGSVEHLTQNMWVHDGADVGLVNRSITFVPGLYKIFDEILVNAADNKQRDPSMNMIKITIDPSGENCKISIWNNGKGIPVVMHKEQKVYVPTLIFGHLLTSSNYNDEERKVTGGRNGYGAKLCNIFSSEFSVETASKEEGKKFKQTWKGNMGKAGEPKITDYHGSDFTCVTFKPDLPKFKMDRLDDDTVALLRRRAYDVAGSTKGVKVLLNGEKLPVTSFRQYVDLYLKGKTDDIGNPLKVVHEVVNPRWEICVAQSDKGFQQVSFVNSIATTKGGRHVDYVVDKLTDKLIEVVKKKNKSGIQVKPFQVKNHLWVFVNCLIENPSFDSQTKENMTLQAKKFGSQCSPSDKFIKNVLSCGVVESIMNWVKFKTQTQMNKKCSGTKATRLKGIPKLDDANDAGTRYSRDCTLILTEGDSAKTLAVSGLGVVGRDKYGVFPLRGKLLNVRDATAKQIMENAEINNIIKIMGLQYKRKYESEDDMKTLRYGKIMIMTDQDQDGSHIKGLLINFIHHNWPSLLRLRFLEEFITPIVKVSKNKQDLSFYSLPEFEEWKSETSNWHTWKVKYYKGLGTSTSKEAKEYFADMQRHRIPFKYNGPEDDAAVDLAFNKKKVDNRKEWLTNWMQDRKQRREMGLGEQYLYGKDTKYLTFNEFVHKELVLFSNSDNERSIPSLVDGLKPGQRKVLFTCLKRNDKREVKVAQLAGSVAEMSAYHHGEVSLMGTIINLAQNFVGSNNVNILQPIGQFGTRIHGGKDAASPRYIFTMLSTLARKLFHSFDEPMLNYQYDDNQKIEPEWYIPIIPMVLVNGAEGIGTGWSTKVPNYDVREIINNMLRMIDGKDPLPMIPSYKNFKGDIEELEENRYVVNGEVAILDNNTIEITELPIRTWTQNYKETVLEVMLHGTDKTPSMITDYKEYHTDTTVRFVVSMTEEQLMKAEAAGLHKVFKLQSNLASTNMVLFDHNGCLRTYNSVQQILQEFFDLRLEWYTKRKDWVMGMLEAEASKLNNQGRFILEKIEGTLVIENKPKRELIQMLQAHGYDSDPVKAWKESQSDKDKPDDLLDAEEEEGESIASSTASRSGPDYNYLLGMPLWNLSKEKKEELLKQQREKGKELVDLRHKTPSDLWKDDLNEFVEELERVEQQEREDEQSSGKIKAKDPKGKNKRTAAVKHEYKPSPVGRRVIPVIDAAMKKAAASKAAQAEKKRVKKEQASDKASEMGDSSFGKDEDEFGFKAAAKELSLAERVAKKTKAGLGGGKSKQSTLNFKPAAKRPKWLDEDSDGSDGDGSDHNMDVVVEPREKAPRRAAAATAKKYISDEENEDDSWAPAGAKDDDDDSFKISDDDDDDFAPKPKKKAAPKKPKILDSEDDDSDEYSPEPKPQKKPAKVTKPPPAPRPDPEPMFGDSGSEAVSIPDIPDSEPETRPVESDGEGPVMIDSDSSTAANGKTKKAPAKKAAGNGKAPAKKAPKKTKEPDANQPSIFDAIVKAKAKKPAPKRKKVTSDSDSDAPAAKPKKAAAKKPAKKKPIDDFISDESDSSAKPKKAPKKKSKKAAYSDDDDDSFAADDFEAMPVAPRARSGRNAASKAKYTYSSDDDDDY